MDVLHLAAPQATTASIAMPGDKSISHRAFLVGAMTQGTTRILGANEGDDVRATIRALRALGVRIVRTADGFIVRGELAFRTPKKAIDCQNSGTTMRLLAGLLAGRVDAVLDGDASLRRRPMKRVTQPLNRMGAHIEASRSGYAPLRISAGQPLRGARLPLEVPSAQVASALMFAALRAKGTTTIVMPAVVRDHTQRLLQSFGAAVSTKGRAITIRPGPLRSPGAIHIPGDLSAAVYFLCAAAVLPGSQLTLRGVGINPTRSVILKILRAMGVRLHLRRLPGRRAEAVADITVRGGAPLRCVPVPARIVPQIIDEIPALCALASCARGVLHLRGARELRYKESDRITTTTALLKLFGANAKATTDGIIVHGGRRPSAPRRVSTYGDHRIGMAAAIVAAAARQNITIASSGCIKTSFPGFARCWRAAFSR